MMDRILKIDLTDNLVLERADDIVAQIRSRIIPGTGRVTLDLADVSVCDPSGIQILISLRNSLHAKNIEFQIENTPDSVYVCAEKLGIPSEFLPPPAPHQP